MRLISATPAARWEDALISGNGATGIMVMGRPTDETIVVNHEKLWVPMVDVKRDVADMRQVNAEARRLAKEGRFAEAADMHMARFTEISQQMYDLKHLIKARRLPVDRVHPGLHLRLTTPQEGPPRDYQRETVLETGEIVVRWTDGRGSWERRAFVSRPHDAIVMRMRRSDAAALDCTLWLTEAPGKLPGDVEWVTIEHRDDEMLFSCAYHRKMGRPEAEGYRALARVICRGGTAASVAGQGIKIASADELLVIMRLEYLDRISDGDLDALRAALALLGDDYDQLLAPHAAVHGEMFSRVRLDLGSGDSQATTEEIIARAEQTGPTAELLELLHAVGRYALIASSGDLPPTLMGIWGDDWTAPWDGRFTFDSNLNLAIAAGSQGNMGEAMDSYFAFIESLTGDWARNAERLFDCRGYVSELTQGYRDGLTMWGSYPWTGGVGWLASYFHDHYLYTGDEAFLAVRVVPLLKGAALFYEDFARFWTDDEGKVVFYPSISPENVPAAIPGGGRTDMVPNATSEIAICRQVLTNLIAACRTLDIDADAIPRWQALLDRLPDYVINADGAIAEWAFGGIEDNYNHRHASHLYGAYPGLEITPHKTPELARATAVALHKRLETGRGNGSAHGLMHQALFAARLCDSALMWESFDELARNGYLYTSLITSHNSGRRIYNLDATLSLPSAIMEMLVQSEVGSLHVLGALPAEHLPAGTIQGVLARGGIVIESLAWDIPAGRLSLTLQSPRVQTIALRGPCPIASLSATQGEAMLTRPARAEGPWSVDLPAGRSVTLEAALADAPAASP